VNTQPYEGVGEMLDALVERGMRLAVLSNKPHPFTVQCVETFLSRWQFHTVHGQSDDFPRKPHPASALHVAEQLGSIPDRILYVGDTATDMQTATAAGMYPVGVLWGFRERAELESNGAKHVITHPRELLPLVI
jgi:phosphoglycolate phosphatase